MHTRTHTHYEIKSMYRMHFYSNARHTIKKATKPGTYKSYMHNNNNKLTLDLWEEEGGERGGVRRKHAQKTNNIINNKLFIRYEREEEKKNQNEIDAMNKNCATAHMQIKGNNKKREVVKKKKL
jgi:hypothetical protein